MECCLLEVVECTSEATQFTAIIKFTDLGSVVEEISAYSTGGTGKYQFKYHGPLQGRMGYFYGIKILKKLILE